MKKSHYIMGSLIIIGLLGLGFFAYNYFTRKPIIVSANSVTLLFFSEGTTAKTLQKSNTCSSVINAGYFDKNDTIYSPAGIWYTNEEAIQTGNNGTDKNLQNVIILSENSNQVIFLFDQSHLDFIKYLSIYS